MSVGGSHAVRKSVGYLVRAFVYHQNKYVLVIGPLIMIVILTRKKMKILTTTQAGPWTHV